MSQEQPVTLKTIANSLGLAINTVSRALRNKDAVSEETRALVMEEAKRLGYVPNSMARSLVLGAGTTLGLVITNPSNPFYADLISAIEQRSRRHGYTLLLMVTEENTDNEVRATEALLQWRVDGAIAVPTQTGIEHWKRLRASGARLVMINRELPELDGDFVGMDYKKGAYEAARHLLRTGHPDIRVLEEDLEISPVKDRIAGFERAIREHGLDVGNDAVLRVPTPRQDHSALPWEPSAAYELARSMVETLQPGSAVMTGTDLFALGVYRATQEKALRIPEDLSVVGQGDYAFSAYINPPLSSVRPPAGLIGASAVDLLLKRIGMGKAADHEPERKVYEPDLVLRGSTR